jgi:hypothetical protein
MAETDNNSQGQRPRRSALVFFLLLGLVTAFLIWFLVALRIEQDACLKQNSIWHPRVICLSNMRGLAKAMKVYANYNDGKYPTADKWCDLLLKEHYATER